MISLLYLSAFAADQGVDTPSGTPLVLQIIVNFEGFTNCSVVGGNGSAAFASTNFLEVADFPSFGANTPIGGNLQAATGGAGWVVGTDVDLSCQVVSGAPFVNVDLSTSSPNAVAADNYGQLAAALPAAGWTLPSFPANGSVHAMTVGVALAPTDPTGTQGQLSYRFVTP